MITPRPAEACEFFGALLGWTFTGVPGMHGYTVHVAGHNIGALWDQNGPNTPKGTPAFIGVMVKVESADAACKQVAKLGGTARPAFDVMDVGRMAVCTDPNGAQFDVWEPKKNPGTDVDNRLHGAPSWFESRTTDVARATAFYSGLFGWKPEEVSPPGMSYTTFKRGGTYVGGMVQLPAGDEGRDAALGDFLQRRRRRRGGGQGRRAGRHDLPVADGHPRHRTLLRPDLPARRHLPAHQVPDGVTQLFV
jgi:predicted enzyme related to lactoylglutathione lyase